MTDLVETSIVWVVVKHNVYYSLAIIFGFVLFNSVERTHFIIRPAYISVNGNCSSIGNLWTSRVFGGAQKKNGKNDVWKKSSIKES